MLFGDRSEAADGVWVDAEVWRGYRSLCSREKLRPSRPIEEFLRFILRDGSAVTVLNMMQGWGKSEGLEAYARVLLNWYTHDRLFFPVTDEEEAPVEPMLLQALRDVKDPHLRREIEEALVIKPRKQARGKREGEEREENGEKESDVDSEGKEVEDSEDDKAKGMSVDEMQGKMSELKRLRELVGRANASKAS